MKSLLPDPRTHMLTLTSIVDRIIEYVTKGDSCHQRETTFLLAFQNCVNEFANLNSGGTVREFIKYWDQKMDSLTVNSAANDDAVTLMTIHKSKGLEFDCVIVPFANWTMENIPKQYDYWMTKEEWLDGSGNKLFEEVGIKIDDHLLPPILPIRKAPARVS